MYFFPPSNNLLPHKINWTRLTVSFTINCLFTDLSIWLFTYLFNYSFNYSFICLFKGRLVCLFTYLFIYLFTCLFKDRLVCVFTYSFYYLFIYLFILFFVPDLQRWMGTHWLQARIFFCFNTWLNGMKILRHYIPSRRQNTILLFLFLFPCWLGDSVARKKN